LNDDSFRPGLLSFQPSPFPFQLIPPVIQPNCFQLSTVCSGLFSFLPERFLFFLRPSVSPPFPTGSPPVLSVTLQIFGLGTNASLPPHYNNSFAEIFFLPAPSHQSSCFQFSLVTTAPVWACPPQKLFPASNLLMDPGHFSYGNVERFRETPLLCLVATPPPGLFLVWVFFSKPPLAVLSSVMRQRIVRLTSLALNLFRRRTPPSSTTCSTVFPLMMFLR